MNERLSTLFDLLEEAGDSPKSLSLAPIWKLFDEIFETIPVEQRLSIAAKVFGELARILDKRSQQFLKDWSDSTDPIGPTVEEGIFSGLVRTSVQLNLEGLKAPTPSQTFKKHGSRPSLKPNDSVVAVVEKERILAMVEQIETIEQIRALAGDEDVSRWQRAIAHFFAVEPPKKIRLTELQKSLSMPMVEVWMGLLLGDYQLSQQGEFYETGEVWVSTNWHENINLS